MVPPVGRRGRTRGLSQPGRRPTPGGGRRDGVGACGVLPSTRIVPGVRNRRQRTCEKHIACWHGSGAMSSAERARLMLHGDPQPRPALRPPDPRLADDRRPPRRRHHASPGYRRTRPPHLWLATIAVDGGPHVTGIGSVWHDGAFWFETGRSTRKGRNLERDPRCTLTVALREFDLVLDGQALGSPGCGPRTGHARSTRAASR